jgi:hypothetical protein
MVNIFFVTLFSAVQFFVKNAGNGISEIFKLSSRGSMPPERLSFNCDIHKFQSPP